MGRNEEAPLKSPEDMLALAEELAARHTRSPAKTKHRLQLRPWMRHALSFLGGAAFTGLCWWASMA